MAKGLYIHIPFCKYICSYCDFGKKYIQNQPVDEYIDCLIKELQMYQIKDDVNTIYIGGGTPSSLSIKQLNKLFDAIFQNVNMVNIVEFTFEFNPDDVNVELLTFLKDNGVSRISIGAQTLNNCILNKVKRKHDGNDVQNAVLLSTKMFENVSVDFMFNLPGQTKADIIECLEFIKNSNIKHISYYGLILEDNTVFKIENNELWDEDYESEIYKFIQNELTAIGYEQYEISNYAMNGFESRHNKHYWNNNNYYAIGLSASGYLNNKRYTNTSSLQKYINDINAQKLPIASFETLTESDILYERIMLGLRHFKFFEISEKMIKFICNNSFLCNKFDITNNKIRLKKEYYYISNSIIIELIEELE